MSDDTKARDDDGFSERDDDNKARDDGFSERDDDNKARDEDAFALSDDDIMAQDEEAPSKRDDDTEAHDEGVLTKRVKLSPKKSSEELEESRERAIDGGEILKIMFQDSRCKTAMTIKKTEMLKILMEQYSKVHNVPLSELSFTFDGQLLTGNETPEDLDMENENCIDVSVFEPVAHSSKTNLDSPVPGCSYAGYVPNDYDDNEDLTDLKNFMNYAIEISFQSSDMEMKIWRTVHMMQPMQNIMHEYAKERNLPLDELAFEFDGQILTGEETPHSLDMDTGNCIDVTVCGPFTQCSRTSGSNVTAGSSHASEEDHVEDLDKDNEDVVCLD